MILGDDSGIRMQSSSHMLKGGKNLKGSSKNQRAGAGSGNLRAGGSGKKLKDKTAPDGNDLEATAPMHMPGMDGACRVSFRNVANPER